MLQSLFSAIITLGLEIELFFRKAGLTLNENGAFTTFKSFKEKHRIHTYYITYTGYIHDIESYICKTGITVEGNSSVELIKAFKIIYTQQK